jgi:hypothetical protein
MPIIYKGNPILWPLLSSDTFDSHIEEFRKSEGLVGLGVTFYRYDGRDYRYVPIDASPESLGMRDGDKLYALDDDEIAERRRL